jgi:hypothetical protein
MATLVSVVNMAHSPFCYMPPEKWDEVRASRSLRADVPHDDLATNRAKAARIAAAFATLRAHLAAAAPDALIVFGDDQLERFDFTNFPSFAVHVGETLAGTLSTGAAARVPGHPALATALLTGLMRRGFDPAFCMDAPAPARPVGHAFLRPAESLTALTTPIVPLFVNCYYAPQPTALRCYQLGRAVREIVDELPGALRVAVVGSGGLWHTPRAKDAHLDEAFDLALLRHMGAGDARAMARHFDDYVAPQDDASQAPGPPGRGATGLPGPGGPQGGTREICNWIAAAAVADGAPATLVDYVPVYASPVGAGFAYWPSVTPQPTKRSLP